MVITSVLNTDSEYVSVCVQKNDQEVRKTLSLNDYRRACSELTMREEHAIHRVGALPAGFVDGGVNEDYHEAIIRVPAGKRPFIYHNKEYVIPFPTTVFHFTTIRGKAHSTRVWFADEEGKLYRYPFGNVYKDNRICWGGNRLPDVHNLKDFDKYVAIFFSASTNDDLYSGVKLVVDGKKVPLAQRDLLEYVSVKDAFPMELLMPYGMSIGEL